MIHKPLPADITLLVAIYFCIFGTLIYHIIAGDPISLITKESDRTKRNVGDNYILHYEVVEGAPRGTILGNVGEDLIQLISSRQTQAFLDKPVVALTITNWRERAVQTFAIDTFTQRLQLAAPPDRETICPPTGTLNVLQSKINEDTFSKPELMEDPKYRKVKRDYVYSTTVLSRPCFVDIKVAFRFSASTHTDAIHDTNKVTRILKVVDPGLITVRVEIQDINDHAPLFPQPRFMVELGELSSVPEKTIIDLPTAFDPDSGPNGTIVYWLSDNVPSLSSKEGGRLTLASSRTPFRLEGNPLRLVLTDTLDWETAREYQLILCAEDFGTPKPRITQLIVQIAVRDENDQVPTFQQDEYAVIINETVPRGTVILELTAKDADSPSNGQMTFSLGQPLHTQERLALQYFGIRTISPNQAVIYVTQTPDVDAAFRSRTSASSESSYFLTHSPEIVDSSRQEFRLQAVVRDNGYPRQLSSKVTINIQVLDVNDMMPTIFVSYLNPVPPESIALNREFSQSAVISEINHGTIVENVDRSFVAFVTVVDLDSGPWGRVHCQTNHEAFNLIPVTAANTVDKDEHFAQDGYILPQPASSGETGYKLVSTKPFDREKTAEVTFQIICVDNVASDDTGQLSILGNQLNRAPANPMQLTGTAVVRVLVSDENDNPPEFRRQHYTFSIDEYNGPITQLTQIDTREFVGQLEAIDPDVSSQVSYYLGNVNTKAFRLEAQTGKLFSQNAFDREQLLKHAKSPDTPNFDGMRLAVEKDESVYILLPVTATDGLNNVSTEIRLLIRDVNDNIPIFSQAQYEFVVPENEQPAQSGLLGTVRAHDVDSGTNAAILYELADVHQLQFSKSNVSGLSSMPLSSKSFFTIGSKTGQLHLIRRLDREQQPIHVFYVLAIDNPRERRTEDLWRTGAETGSLQRPVGVSSHTATTTVTVIVADVNDNSPRITYPPPHGLVNIESGAPAGHNLFTVTAEDPDAGENGTVRFSLTLTSFENVKPKVGRSGASSSSTKDGSKHPKSSEERQSSSPFAIDENTGIVFVVEKLMDHTATYLLVVEANDLGRPERRKVTSTVSIRVQSTQSHHSSSPYGFSGAEKMPHKEIKVSRLAPSASSADELDDRIISPVHHASAGRLHESERQLGRHSSSDVMGGSATANKVAYSGRFFSVTDRTVVVSLATIFALLLMTTVFLILLIRRRRDQEQSGDVAVKPSYRAQSSNNMSKIGLMQSVQFQNQCHLSPGNTKMHNSSPSRVRSMVIHDGHCPQGDLEASDYGAANLYVKSHLYAVDDTNCMTNHMDYQQILPTHVLTTTLPISVYKRNLTVENITDDQHLSNSLELLSLSESVCENPNLISNKQPGDFPEGSSKKNMSAPTANTGLVNNRQTRNTSAEKRYQTIDFMAGTHGTFMKDKTSLCQDHNAAETTKQYAWNGDQTLESMRLKEVGAEYSELSEATQNGGISHTQGDNGMTGVSGTAHLQQVGERPIKNKSTGHICGVSLFCDQADSLQCHASKAIDKAEKLSLGLRKHSKTSTTQANGVTFV